MFEAAIIKANLISFKVSIGDRYSKKNITFVKT